MLIIISVHSVYIGYMLIVTSVDYVYRGYMLIVISVDYIEARCMRVCMLIRACVSASVCVRVFTFVWCCV